MVDGLNEDLTEYLLAFHTEWIEEDIGVANKHHGAIRFAFLKPPAFWSLGRFRC